MSNLLDKLNVLVRSSINSLGSSKIPAARLGKDIDGEIAALRKKINEALATEDAMQQRVDALLKQAAGFDQQADEALKHNDENNARFAVQEMHRLQQQATMVQADLENHRRSTSDFIERVNMLEAMVSDARREQQQKQAQAPDPQTEAQQTEQQALTEDHSPGVVLSNLLRDARERVENAIAQKPGETGEPVHNIKITIDNSSNEPTPKTQQTDQKADQAKEAKQVDDDLAQRRSRLSKPE